MICEKVLGNIETEDYSAAKVFYVDIEWYDTCKKLHKKAASDGTEVGLRFDNAILQHGLRQGDILYQDSERILAVNIPPCECIVIDICEDHPFMLGKVCYEIGNKHAALFWGESYQQVITPYNEPTKKLLEELHGIRVQVQMIKLNMDHSIASSINNHTH